MSDLDKSPDQENNDKPINEEAPPSAEVNSADEGISSGSENCNANSSKERPKGDSDESAASKIADIGMKAAKKGGEAVVNACEQVREYDPNTMVRYLDRGINWARQKFPADLYDKISGWLVTYGDGCIVLAQVLILVFFTINARIAAEGDSFFRFRWTTFLIGIGTALLLVVLQYTADKFLDAGRKLIESTPSKLSSQTFLDCTALILEIVGFLTVVSMLSVGWVPTVIALGIWALLDSVAFTALHPTLVNVSTDDELRAGEEAIGILSFLAKAALKVIPIAYGVGAILGAAALLVATGALLFGQSAVHGNYIIGFILIFTCLPFVGYLAFMAYHLLLDLLRAILVLPGKIDSLK